MCQCKKEGVCTQCRGLWRRGLCSSSQRSHAQDHIKSWPSSVTFRGKLFSPAFTKESISDFPQCTLITQLKYRNSVNHSFSSLQLMAEFASSACACTPAQMRPTVFCFQPHGLQPPRLLCPWDCPSKTTRVGYHALLQGIFLTQRSNPWFLN